MQAASELQDLSFDIRILLLFFSFGIGSVALQKLHSIGSRFRPLEIAIPREAASILEIFEFSLWVKKLIFRLHFLSDKPKVWGTAHPVYRR